MIKLPFSIILLAATAFLVLIGAGQRVLDRMRLTDGTAILLLGLLIVAHFLPVIAVTSYIGIHLGALIPLGVITYLLITCEKHEQIRALIISLVAAAALWLSDQLLPTLPGQLPFDIDPLYLPGVIAGLIAYFTTKSRRTAFISAVAAVFLNDLAAILAVSLKTYHARTVIGGGGIF
ncbi:MAG TPA: hypothetical protein VJ064_06470, partial [Limnochordia bacterium]|nr:hypothetical protein [Limnochordia bacterium]